MFDRMRKRLNRHPQTTQLIAWTSLLYVAYLAIWITFKLADKQKEQGWSSLDTSMSIGLTGLTFLFAAYTYTEYRIEDAQLTEDSQLKSVIVMHYGSEGNTGTPEVDPSPAPSQ